MTDQAHTTSNGNEEQFNDILSLFITLNVNDLT